MIVKYLVNRYILFYILPFIECLEATELSFEENYHYDYKSDKSPCETCQKEVDGFIDFVRSEPPDSLIWSEAYKLCLKYYANASITCTGKINLELETILYIINNRQNLTGEGVCALYKQNIGCADKNEHSWTIDIPPKLVQFKTMNEKESQRPLKILHLTDIHFDPLYQPGSNAKCDLLLCCQNDSGTPATPKEAAGHWGDYGICDIPWYSVLNLMNQIKKQHEQIDYVYYTGDIVSGIDWKTTVDTNTRDIKQLLQLFHETFQSTPVFVVLGNHESHPANFYSQNILNLNISTQWLYNLVDKEWSRWLPKSTSVTIKKGGYYTVLVRPHFRIIGLNSNLCYTNNIWLVFDDVDPLDQLKWLVDVLTQAERNNEYVHILTHIPPGHIQCHKIWNREYIKIVNRFSHIIQAQFNGHTHKNEFKLFYDGSNVSNVIFGGGSFSTYIGYNPNYKVYDVDPNSFEVLNFDLWTFNLTQANQNNNTPKWYKLYNFLEDYPLKTMSKDDLGTFVEMMRKNNSLKYQYYRHLIRDSNAEIWKDCNGNCLDANICRITNVLVEDALSC